MNVFLRSLLSVALLFYVSMSHAQDRAVSGTVTDENGATLPGVNVVVKGTTTGTVTDIDGNYKLTIPSDGAILVFTFIGYESQEIDAGARSVIDIQLSSDVTQLSEVVVTGVSVGTSTKKLGFSVGKVDGEKLAEVPAADPANALRGKVAGVKVVQNGGGPGSSPSILLRGVTSLGGTNAPLIIVDGIITHNSIQNVLSDINPDDIETIEVVKGAAAASLYGSLAGNGAIQIITKRGSGIPGETRVTVRNEVGWDQLPTERTPALAFSHNYITDPDGTFPGGVKSGEADTRVDNPFPVNNDIIDEMLEANITYTNSVSIASSKDQTNFLLGFENFSQGGPFRDQDRFDRRSARLNVDHRPIDKLELSTSVYYAFSRRPVYQTAGQGDNIIYGLLVNEPDIDVNTLPTESNYDPNTNADHPLYLIQNLDNFVERDRFLGSLGAKYEVTDWLKLDGTYSLDYLRSQGRRFIEKGLFRPDQDAEPGTIDRRNNLFRKQFVTLKSIFNRKFDLLNATFAYTYQFENDERDSDIVQSSNLAAIGVPQLQNADPATRNVASSFEEINSIRHVFNVILDYNDRYIFDAVFSRDGSSLFGENERWQSYFRVSGAYRINEDFDIPGFQELKLRGSFGTTGDRPPFQARFETFNVRQGAITQDVLGNPDLRPAEVSELEIGLNATFLERFRLEFNYADGESEDQWLQIPLSPISGATSTFRNVGTIETSVWEASLGIDILDQGDWGLSIDLFADRAVAEVTQLDVPPFGINGNLAINGATGGLARETFGEQLAPASGNATTLFRIENGVRLGTMYGNSFARSLDQLNVDENGIVTNGGINLPLSDFVVNRDGYVVVDANRFTPSEVAILIEDENGIPTVGRIGDSNPDFNYSFGFNFFWKNLTVYALFDGQQGGDIYNNTEQNLIFNRRSAFVDQASFPEAERKHNEYFQSLYNLNNPSSHFVEDASFLKFRELAISYKFPRTFFQKLGPVGDVIHDAKLSLIGRNLALWSDYSGFDPEVATANSAPIFRFDEYSYPQFRSFTVGLELRF